MTASRVILSIAAGTALAAFGASAGLAQTTTAAPAQPESMTRVSLAAQLDSEFKDLDANHDGKLTKTEIQTAMTRRAAEAQAKINAEAKEIFNKIDTNHNGSISLAEFQAQQKLSVDPAKVDARVTQLDTNHDGTISAEEYRNATLSEFDKADINHDGVVSAAEAGQGR